jgi:hypothetical protein
MILCREADGTDSIKFTKEETLDLLVGKPIIKQSGDCHGLFKIVVKLTRAKTKAKRFPEGVF